MIAKLERRAFDGAAHTSALTYRNLHNLPHWHEEHELVYVQVGEVMLNVNQEHLTLHQGNCAFIKGGEIHSMSGSVNSVTCVIKTEAQGLHAMLKDRKLCSPLLKHDYGFEKTFRALRAELTEREDYGAIVADCLTVCFVAQIFRMETTESTLDAQKSNGKYKQLLEWMNLNFATVTFEEAADYMGFSKTYFSSYFQRLAGMSFTQYLNALKISTAVEKLAQGEKNVTEISSLCGFNTIRHFNRVFKLLTGYAPRELPRDYVHLHHFRDNIGFDPTLSCSELVER